MREGGLRGLLAAPEPGFYERPELHLVCGGELELTGVRVILCFDGTLLTAGTAGWLITLYGSGLRIEALSGRRLRLSGKVDRVELEKRRGGKAK